MNKITYTFILAILGFSCNPQPEACFTPENSEIEFGETFTLTNCSKKSSSYNINWGDGVFDKEATLSHNYTIPGNFTVNITVFSTGESNYDETQVFVEVKEPNYEKVKTNWTNYKIEAFTNGADEQISQNLTSGNKIGTDLTKEPAQSYDVNFQYQIEANSATVTNEDNESEQVSWSSSVNATIYINSYPYRIVSLSSKEMILRADNADQFLELDENNEYNLDSFDGYFLIYFSR